MHKLHHSMPIYARLIDIEIKVICVEENVLSWSAFKTSL